MKEGNKVNKLRSTLKSFKKRMSYSSSILRHTDWMVGVGVLRIEHAIKCSDGRKEIQVYYQNLMKFHREKENWSETKKSNDSSFNFRPKTMSIVIECPK